MRAAEGRKVRESGCRCVIADGKFQHWTSRGITTIQQVCLALPIPRKKRNGTKDFTAVSFFIQGNNLRII